MEKNIIKIRTEIEHVVAKHYDLIGAEASTIEQENGIPSSKILQGALEAIKDENRLLQIGIIGRVKAGKSSLLNSLLFAGQTVLPKAATPMTASLTVLSYGEKISAEIEFYSKDDIELIRSKYNEYIEKKNLIAKEQFELLKKQLEKQKRLESASENYKLSLTKEEISEIEKRSERLAQKHMDNYFELSASYDQYTRIKSSKHLNDNKNEKVLLEASDYSELNKMLHKYVGADGVYMPFTKSVQLKMPHESLKDIQIIDTPGFNDPVQSREARTREYLKYCDVIIIVSPSGMFLSKQDVELMDRITTKEGITELLVVASQIDTQILGFEKDEFNGDLIRLLNHQTTNLGKHLSSTISQLKVSSPEVGNSFDQLLGDNKEILLYSSSSCESISNAFNNRNIWDEGLKKVWGNLCDNYPDYFSDSDELLSQSNLKLLANIQRIQTSLQRVREKKENILKTRLEQYSNSQFHSLVKQIDELKKYSNNQHNLIETNNVDEIKTRKKSLEKLQIKASRILNEEYHDLVDDLKTRMKNEIVTCVNSYFKEANTGINSSQETKSETITRAKSGVLPWLGRLFGVGGYTTTTENYTSIRTGAVRSILEELTLTLENTITSKQEEIVRDWKRNLFGNLVGTLRRITSDDDLDPQLIRTALRNVLATIKYPEIIYSGSLPGALTAKGSLRDSEANDFIDAAIEYLVNLKSRVMKDIDLYQKDLVESLKQHDPTLKIFENYSNIISELEEQIRNKEIILSRFKTLLKELQSIEI